MSSTPNECVNNSNCGWCGDKSKCIPGNNRGPLAPCLRNTYLFNTNTQDWNPLKAGAININTGGAVQMVSQPNLNNVFVNSPYN